MKQIQLAMIIATAVAVCGCGGLMSVRPLGPAGESLYDPSLIGAWAGTDDTYVVTQDRENGYNIYVVKDKTVLKGRIFAISGEMILDLIADEPGAFSIPAHVFLRVRRMGGDVELRFLGSERLQNSAKSSGLPYFECDGKTPCTVLTARTEQVRDLIAKFGLREDALEDPVILHPVGR